MPKSHVARLAGMAQWIVGIIEQHGYFAVAALMLLENVFPPVPSELIMPFAGFVSSRGDMSVVGVVLAGTLGSLLGTLPWYWAGRKIGHQRLKAWAGRRGRWLAVEPAEIDRAHHWFQGRGAAAVFFGRLVPALRSVISAPAGVADMPLLRFLLWSAFGSLIWVSALTWGGHALADQYDVVMRWIEPVTRVVLVGGLIVYLWRVWRFKPQG